STQRALGTPVTCSEAGRECKEIADEEFKSQMHTCMDLWIDCLSEGEQTPSACARTRFFCHLGATTLHSSRLKDCRDNPCSLLHETCCGGICCGHVCCNGTCCGFCEGCDSQSGC